MSQNDAILKTALRAIEEGTTTYSELLALCVEKTPLLQQAEAERDEPFEYLIFLLEETGKVKVLEEEDRVILYGDLLEGVVLTHRLDEEEIRDGLVSGTPDLIGIETGLDPIPLVAGGSASLEFNRDDETKYDEHGSLEGPPGWLEGFQPGDLVVFTRVGDALELEAVSNVADPSEEVAALGRAFESMVDRPGVGAEPSEILQTALEDSPGLFRRPLLPLGELLGEAGLEVEGGWAGRQGEEWKPPGVARLDELTRDVEASFDMESCCVDAFRTATDHWRHRENSDPVAAAKALGHGPVADAFLDWYDRLLGVEYGGFGDFLRGWIANAGRHAGSVRYVYAVHLDAIGDAISAEAELDTAVRLDPEYAPALWMLAEFASDRGDALRTVSLLERARVDPDNPDLEFHRSLLGDLPNVGRNDPCPCGSGRKFKACHLNSPVIDPQKRVQWMLSKVDRFMHAHHRHDRYDRPATLATQAFSEGLEVDDFIRMAGEPFIFELAMFEDGGVADFLAERGDLLSEEERDVYDLWSQASLALWEVMAVTRGETVELRDTRSGDHVEVFDRSVAGQFSAGDMILARPLPGFGSTWLSAVVLPIDLRERDALLELFDSGADADSLAYWYGSRFRPPTIQTTEGEPAVFSEATLKPTGDWRELGERLDQIYEADGDDVWRSMHAPGDDGSRIVRATLTREGDQLRVSTNAVERLDRVLAELGDEVELVERIESEMDWKAALSEASAGNFPDLDPEVREEIIGLMEDKWLGESIPALGGSTPREAANDPTRLEDLEALLRMIGDRDQTGPGMTMRAGSLRRKLGIGDD